MKNKCVWLGSFLLVWLLFCVSAAQAGGSDYASFSSERTLNIGDTTTMWFPGPTGTYQWYIWLDDVMQEIPGATDDEYTTGPITKPVKYTCVGTFENGSSESRDFMIYLKTNLEAEAAGSSELILHPDQQAVLRVQASVDTGAVSYQWYRNNMQEILEGEKTSVCVIGPFSDQEIIGCRVYDEFGNSKDVLFSIRIDSGLRAEADLSEMWIQSGQSAVLKVNASADYGAVSYQWYGEGGDAELDGQISSTYTTRPLNKSAVYTCTVSDDYGSIREIRFFVRIENGFHAEAVGSELRLVEEGEDVTLSVNASCQEGNLSYCWRDVETNSVLSTESSLTIENVTESRKYRCLASDENGNGRYIEFMVVRRNGIRHSRPVMYIEGSTYETVLAISFEAESSGWYELGASFEESGADNISLFDSRGRLIATEYISVEMNHLKVKLTEGDTYYFVMDGISGEGIYCAIIKQLDASRYGRLLLRYGQKAEIVLPAWAGNVIRSEPYYPGTISVTGTRVYAMATGDEELTLETENGMIFTYIVEVERENVIYLPSELREVKECAFDGNEKARFVELGENTERVESNAFRNTGLKQIVIRGLHTVLAADAFGDGESEVSPQILCLRGSEAEAFAVANGYDYAYLLE